MVFIFWLKEDLDFGATMTPLFNFNHLIMKIQAKFDLFGSYEKSCSFDLTDIKSCAFFPTGTFPLYSNFTPYESFQNRIFFLQYNFLSINLS